MIYSRSTKVSRPKLKVIECPMPDEVCADCGYRCVEVIDMEQDAIDAIAKHLVDQGLLIEAGWQMLKLMSVSPNASQIQLNEMRNAFFAGAQHLFASIMGILDPGSEPTDADMERMDNIAKELQNFYNEFLTKHGMKR